jgi:transcriptional regulator with XRE-family HTH domain
MQAVSRRQAGASFSRRGATEGGGRGVSNRADRESGTGKPGGSGWVVGVDDGRVEAMVISVDLSSMQGTVCVPLSHNARRSTMPGTRKGYEPQANALGKLLRSARGPREQIEIAKLVGVSDSALSRFETGQAVPDLEVARRLDEVLQLGGDVRERARGIIFPVGRVLPTAARRLIVAVFPPDYIGAVHVHLQAAADQEAADVGVELIWGNWSHRRALLLDAIGTALLFAKVDASNRSVPLRIHASVPVGATYGCGTPIGLPDDRVVDANDGWDLRSQPVPRTRDEN